MKREKIVIAVMLFADLVGFIAVILKGINDIKLIMLYLFLIPYCIFALYFNRALCRFDIKWYNLWHTKGETNSEPSDSRLIAAKIAEWLVLIIGVILLFILLIVV